MLLYKYILKGQDIRSYLSAVCMYLSLHYHIKRIRKTYSLSFHKLLQIKGCSHPNLNNSFYFLVKRETVFSYLGNESLVFVEIKEKFFL